jgi:hypothetical protein
MEPIENSLELFISCLNLSLNNELSELGQKEINIINDIIIILRKELFTSNNEKLEKLIYEGLYIISKIDNKYKFNEKMVKEGIPQNILNINFENYDLLIKGLKLLTNILTVSDKECKIIIDKNIINYYNDVLDIYDNDPKIVYIILSGIVNICDSKFRSIIKESIIWSRKKIEKYFNMHDNIKLKFIKIIKYMIINGTYNNLLFIYNLNVLEYFIYLLSSFNLGDKVTSKIIKLINIYLNQFNDSEKKNIEYYTIFYKFQDLNKLLHKYNK